MECLVVRKTFLKLQRFSIPSVILQQSVGALRSHIDLKRCFDTLFKAEIFTVAAKLKALVLTSYEVGVQAGKHVQLVNIVFLKSIWDLPEAV